MSLITDLDSTVISTQSLTALQGGGGSGGGGNTYVTGGNLLITASPVSIVDLSVAGGAASITASTVNIGVITGGTITAGTIIITGSGTVGGITSAPFFFITGALNVTGDTNITGTIKAAGDIALGGALRGFNTVVNVADTLGAAGLISGQNDLFIAGKITGANLIIPGSITAGETGGQTVILGGGLAVSAPFGIFSSWDAPVGQQPLVTAGDIDGLINAMKLFGFITVAAP